MHTARGWRGIRPLATRHNLGRGQLRYGVPIEVELVDELRLFWESIFGSVFPEIGPEVFLGAEEDYSRSRLYLRKEGGRVVGTCFTMQSRSAPAIAGFGEVATAEPFRGRGIATALCSQAVEELRAAGGEAFFLGTVNPAAARVYYRLGWRKLAGAEVMVNVVSGESPEAFLEDYFRVDSAAAAATVAEATPADRIPMIPLIVCPHDWQVLDANTKVLSTRYATQISCMGLHLRYQRITQKGEGAWYSARTADGRVVGLSTARKSGGGDVQVDGFTHARFAGNWEGLLQAAMEGRVGEGALEYFAVVSVEDEEKQDLFRSLGFREAGAGKDFELDGRRVASLRMEKRASQGKRRGVRTVV